MNRMTPRFCFMIAAVLLSLSCLGLSMAWAAPCASLLESETRFDSVVTSASGRLLSRGPVAIKDIRAVGEETLFRAMFTPNDAAPVQLTGLARGDEVSMVVDGGALPEDTSRPAWLGRCSDTGITGRIGGNQGFELLPAAEPEDEATPAQGVSDAGNATTPGAPQTSFDDDDWPAASEAPYILAEDEETPEANASGLDDVEELPQLPEPADETTTGDPVAEALRELAMQRDAQETAEPAGEADGYAIRPEINQNATEAMAETEPDAQAEITAADCRYLPRSVYGDDFPNMRLSPIHSTAATIPGRDQVCFLTLQAGEGAQGDVDFAFYDGSEPLATMRGPGIPVTVRGLSLRDLSGDGAPEVIAVLQRTDGGYENRVYWSEKKGDGFVWVEDAVVNRHVSGQSTVGGVIEVITGEKVSTVDDTASQATTPEPEPAAPPEPTLTPEPIQPERAPAPAPEIFDDAGVGDVVDLTGRFVRTGQGLRFIPYGRVLDTTYVVDSMPPEDEARLGDITRRDSRISAEVMRLDTVDGKPMVHIQVLQVQLL